VVRGDIDQSQKTKWTSVIKEDVSLNGSETHKLWEGMSWRICIKWMYNNVWIDKLIYSEEIDPQIKLLRKNRISQDQKANSISSRK
jgi:hypothetical protein